MLVLLAFDVPVHDDPVWDVDALYVLVVVLRVGEQVQTVSGPVIFYLKTQWLFKKKLLDHKLGRLPGECPI